MKTVAFILPIRIFLATIVNVALNDMRGNLGATINEIAWVGYRLFSQHCFPIWTCWIGSLFLICVPFVIIFVKRSNRKISLGDAGVH
jgi:hypothetical protein